MHGVFCLVLVWGGGQKKKLYGPHVLKRMLKNAIEYLFNSLYPSGVNWLSYMHFTRLPGLGCLLHHSGDGLAGSAHGEVYATLTFALAGSAHGEVYATLTFALAGSAHGEVYATLTFALAGSAHGEVYATLTFALAGSAHGEVYV